MVKSRFSGKKMGLIKFTGHVNGYTVPDTHRISRTYTLNQASFTGIMPVNWKYLAKPRLKVGHRIDDK